MRKFCLKALLLVFSMMPALVVAENISLKVALIRAGGQQYFIDLLQQSLEASGHKVSIDVMGNLPQKRMIAMMEDNELSLTWLVQSQARDERFIPVEVGITEGLIGHRILLIPKGQQPLYDQVQTLNDFRNLNRVGVFGKNWFDVKIWQFNRLRFIEKEGGWQKKVYRQIAAGNRGIDYFSRGFFEVLEEAAANPYLDVESHLMLVYDRDFRFYLSESAGRYKAVITEALVQAQKTGLMSQLIRKHWASSFERLNPQNRVRLNLQNPGG